MFTECSVMSQARHRGSESMARARVGRFWAVGWQRAELRLGQWSFVQEHTSAGTGTLLSCPPSTGVAFIFSAALFSLLFFHRGGSSPLAQGRLQQLPLAVPLHGGTSQIQQWHHTAAGPSPRSVFTFSCLYLGLNDFWRYALLILKCWILKSRLH